MQSRRSNDHVPVIATKHRQLARPNTPAEVNLTESQRLLSVIDEPPVAVEKQSSETKEKLVLWLFLLLSGIIMYYAMHPNKKV